MAGTKPHRPAFPVSGRRLWNNSRRLRSFEKGLSVKLNAKSVQSGFRVKSHTILWCWHEFYFVVQDSRFLQNRSCLKRNHNMMTREASQEAGNCHSRKLRFPANTTWGSQTFSAENVSNRQNNFQHEAKTPFSLLALVKMSMWRETITMCTHAAGDSTTDEAGNNTGNEHLTEIPRRNCCAFFPNGCSFKQASWLQNKSLGWNSWVQRKHMDLRKVVLSLWGHGFVFSQKEAFPFFKTCDILFLGLGCTC